MASHDAVFAPVIVKLTRAIQPIMFVPVGAAADLGHILSQHQQLVWPAEQDAGSGQVGLLHCADVCTFPVEPGTILMNFSSPPPHTAPHSYTAQLAVCWLTSGMSAKV